jgi:hypothetical protein
MRAIRVWLVGLCLWTASVCPSVAGIGKGNGELGFDFGVTTWDSDLTGGTGPLLKIRGGYFATRWFEIEGQAAYSVHFDEVNTQARKYDDDQKLRQYFVSGVFNFHSKSGRVVPYVLAGVGMTNMIFLNNTREDDSIAWQAAAGSRFFFGHNDQVAFRIEAAFLFDETFDQSNRHDQYAVGFSWRLGGGS